MTTKLQVYNDALRLCGESSLASLTEAREPRYLLDEVYANGGIDFCLAQGFWQFAMISVQVDYDTDIEPAFGLQRAFTKPSDWVKTAAVCSDEHFKAPLLEYYDEVGYWYADIDTIYVKYVSNGVDYGYNLADWPQTFADYVSAHFASKIVVKLTGDEDKKESVLKERKRLLLDAKNHDASGNPQQFPAPGNWLRSRGRSAGRERGSTGSLTG
jgi:hypothetical protein